MIGYHYTAKRLYSRIKKEGLKLYPITHYELAEYFPSGVDGIWIWNRKLRGKAELGSVMWQVATKADYQVVKLEVKYEKKNALRYHGKLILLHHGGNIGNWQYHSYRETSHIIIIPIPPENIEMVKEYNLLDLLKEGEHGNT